MSAMQTITVEAGHRPYDIHIGPGILARVGALLPPDMEGRRAFIVTDGHVAPHALAAFTAAWPGASRALVLPPGEKTKSMEGLDFVLTWLLSEKIDRDGIVIALGGGVMGDLAGLAAAMVLRGVDYIQVPTTLLAQVDSAVGGKVAVNMPQGKNMAGAYHHPVAVISDTALLATLPEREHRAGYAEIVKYGAIADEGFFQWLEENGRAVLAGDAAALAHAVAVSCRMKAAIVARDERDDGERMMLNFGHSFGHALEALSGYDGRILHGEAVAAGMAMAARFSRALGFGDDGGRIERHLAAHGLPVAARAVLPDVTADDMLAAMKRDKKGREGRMTLILLRAMGQAFVERGVAEDALQEFLGKDMGYGGV